MERIFFTSDSHYGHKRILELGNGRPFASIEEMDEALIANWNAVVTPQDRVYHLGDVSWYRPEPTRRILDRLNGRIHLITGNHDGSQIPPVMRDRFDWVGTYKMVKIDGQSIALMHFPLLEWDRCNRGSWHLHGHQHGNGEPTTVPRVDVGVDCFNFTPVSFEEIAEIMQDREWVPVSHH